VVMSSILNRHTIGRLVLGGWMGDRLQKGQPGTCNLGIQQPPRLTQPPTLCGMRNEYQTKCGMRCGWGVESVWLILFVDNRVSGR